MEKMKTIFVSSLKLSSLEEKADKALNSFLAQNPNAEIKNFQQSFDRGSLIITIWYRDHS